MSSESAARRVGPFQLEERLGAGGMGMVYRATYLKTGQQCALKMLAPDLTNDPRIAERFEREMEILQKLKHPHIVQYYGGSRRGGQMYYAMELVTGGALDRVIKKRGRLPWEEVVRYGLQIAKALEHAHAAGVIHRDLKPANLLLTKQGVLKLTDFGIARDTEATALTQAGKTVGTMAYMAPEQITGKHPVGRKTDLYALGCVLFEMLTGKTVFQSATQPEMLFKHIQEEPPSVREIAWEAPIWLEELINELLEKEPQDRPYDALAVQVRLQEILDKVAQNQTVVAQKTQGGGRAAVTMQNGEVVTKSSIAKKKRKAEAERAATPFWQRGWFLAAALALLIGLVTWMAWPESEPELYARIEAQVTRLPDEDLHQAEGVLKNYADSFPQGPHIAEVRQTLDDIQSLRAERLLETRLRLGKDPETEGERLWIEAKQFERFGDRLTALEKYDAMQTVLQNNENARPFRNLARRQAEKIRSSVGGADDRIAFITGQLEKADELFQQKKTLEAVERCDSIIKLYSGRAEFAPLVAEAEARLVQFAAARNETPVGRGP